ncbi:MAG: hypothetical protein ACRDGQ_02305 [Candidatus Limnocylindrales bacterium]
MAQFVLQVCGFLAVAIGAVRGYSLARQAVAPLVHDGDPTRSAIEATRRITDRPRVRLFARRVAGAVAWLALAGYGLFMIVAGQVAR